MILKDLMKEVHITAKEKGWWDLNRSPGEILFLVISEVTEAFEEWRAGRKLQEIYYKDGKPEGVPVELADAVIRIADFCEFEKIPLEEAIKIKLEFNKTRSYRHGNKQA